MERRTFLASLSGLVVLAAGIGLAQTPRRPRLADMLTQRLQLTPDQARQVGPRADAYQAATRSILDAFQQRVADAGIPGPERHPEAGPPTLTAAQADLLDTFEDDLDDQMETERVGLENDLGHLLDARQRRRLRRVLSHPLPLPPPPR